MKLLPIAAAAGLAMTLCIGGGALADPWENDDDQGSWYERQEAPRYEHGDHYGRGDCRVKGKWKHGEYVEKMKCKGHKHRSYRHEPD